MEFMFSVVIGQVASLSDKRHSNLHVETPFLKKISTRTATLSNVIAMLDDDVEAEIHVLKHI